MFINNHIKDYDLLSNHQLPNYQSDFQSENLLLYTEINFVIFQRHLIGGGISVGYLYFNFLVNDM